MNITHAVDEKIEGDRLIAIFERQKELMLKYKDIEERSGLMQTNECPVNLDDKKGQARIKDFCWRIVEEIGEAIDASEDHEHHVEELIDGLHFLVEMTIISGFAPEQIVWQKLPSFDLLDSMIVSVMKMGFDECLKTLVMDLGMLGNCLKNKPWKQTNMLTDKDEFERRLRLVWIDYITILSLDMSSDDIVNIYFKKSQVNKFRQRSNY